MFRCESGAFAFQEHDDYHIIHLTYTPRIWVGEIWVLDFIDIFIDLFVLLLGNLESHEQPPG